jgi:signal transduction histidine kinase
VDPRELASLLSLISHEVRSPLGVVRGYLRMLNQRRGDLSDHHQQLVTAALKASERAAELLAQVSTLAQLHRAEMPFDFKPVPLGPVVEATVSGTVLPTEPIVNVRVGRIEALEVVADTGLLQSALTSVLSSLVRAQGRETTIDISAAREPRDAEDGVTIRMAADNETGVQASKVPLDLGRGGLGLELPIAAAIIQAHCGHVDEVRTASGYAGVVVWLPTEAAGLQPGGPTAPSHNH